MAAASDWSQLSVLAIVYHEKNMKRLNIMKAESNSDGFVREEKYYTLGLKKIKK